MNLTGLNHLVLPVSDVERSAAFYTTVLHMWRVGAGGRTALHFGESSLELVDTSDGRSPQQHRVVPGSARICFDVSQSATEVQEELRERAVSVVAGPTERVGALGAVRVVYLLDPDGNLIELASGSRVRARKDVP